MTLTRKLRGIIRLFRPELPFAAGVCVVLGEIIALGNFPPLRELLLGFVSGFFLSSTALILNDYFDLEVDKINAPERSLPAGLVSSSEAIVLSMITTILGLAASYSIGLSAFILSVTFWFVGFLYNWKLKETGLFGNLMVSASVAITFVLGGIAVGEPWNKIVWTFSLMAFFIDLGEEIAGDAMDLEGDKKRRSSSIALNNGRNVAVRISGFLFMLVVLISYIPAFLGWLGTSYLIIISITNVITLHFTVSLLKSRTPDQGRGSMRGIYLGALFGMLAFILGQIFE